MSLKLYYDLMSPVSRVLYVLLKKVNYNFETKLVDLGRAEHFSDDFTKNVNRFRRVPVINHNGFILTESVAILKYLSRENIVPDSLFPKESNARARVDEFLEWHHVGMLDCAMYFRITFLDPKIKGRPTPEKQIEEQKQHMLNALNDFNTKWLGQGHDFVIRDSITVADLFAACILEQPRLSGYDPCKDYKNIATWMNKVRDHFNPYYDEGHTIINKVIKKNEKVKASSKI